MHTDTPIPLILVDDEPHIRMAAGQTLELAGYDVTAFERAEPVLEKLDEAWSGVLVTDINLPGIDEASAGNRSGPAGDSDYRPW